MTEENLGTIWPRLKDPTVKDTGDSSQVKPWTRLEDIINYRTSTGIGLVHTVPTQHFSEKNQPELCREYIDEDLEVVQATYLTTNKKDFDLKFVDPDPISKADKPAFRNFLFMQNAHEKSEMKDKYKPFYEPKASGEVKNFYNQVHCKLKGITRGDQPKLKLEDDGYGKYLDIYTSQSHLDYTYKHPLHVHKLNNMPAYEPPMYPTSPRKNKVAEDIFVNRPLPKPGAESISETKASFVRKEPLVDEQTTWPLIQFKQTKGDVIATPGMYHTEYSHIGSDWLVDALV